MEYQRRPPVLAKGKTAPLRAFRAVRTTTAVPRQFRGVPGLRAPLIGRDRELQLIINTFSRVVEDRQAYLFTLLGAAGIGKSRLIEEGLRRIAADFSPRVRQGRCLPYGKGITYWPFIESFATTPVSVSRMIVRRRPESCTSGWRHCHYHQNRCGRLNGAWRWSLGSKPPMRPYPMCPLPV